MAYSVPDFNLTAAVWVPGNDPIGNPPDFPAVPCQVYRNSRQQTNSQAMLRIPSSFASIPLPGDSGFTVDLFFEVPAGSGAYYRADRGLWMHRGFPNEYIGVLANPVVRNAADTAFIFSDSDTDLV